VRLLAPTPLHWPLLREAIGSGETSGNLVFDAEIAALCREHGVERILTEDRDFGRFPFLFTVSLADEPASLSSLRALPPQSTRATRLYQPRSPSYTGAP